MLVTRFCLSKFQIPAIQTLDWNARLMSHFRGSFGGRSFTVLIAAAAAYAQLTIDAQVDEDY